MQDKRFVVQEHTTGTGVHWDFMLEQGDVLTTFRLEAIPASDREFSVGAERIFDHALRFLDYEGPVQQGTGRVRIIDRGTYRPLDSPSETLVIELSGDILQGRFALTPTDETHWHFARIVIGTDT